MPRTQKLMITEACKVQTRRLSFYQSTAITWCVDFVVLNQTFVITAKQTSDWKCCRFQNIFRLNFLETWNALPALTIRV